MASKNTFINGITDLIILYLLKQKDCYVYEITKAISELSEGFLDISQNTIYTAAYKLENDGMITESSRLVGRKRTRVYYHIEPDGEKYLERMLASYRTTFCGMEKFLSKSIVDLQESKERKKKSE